METFEINKNVKNGTENFTKIYMFFYKHDVVIKSLFSEVLGQNVTGIKSWILDSWERKYMRRKKQEKTFKVFGK